MSDMKIGFIGYGAMARLMGANLRRAGYSVVAFAPSGGKDETEMLPTPRAIAEAADVIILCVPNDAAENQSLNGENGMLAGISAGKLVLDTSTVSPEQALALAKTGAEHGFIVLEAPMSGSTPEAEKGELVMLAGGDAETLERAKPILDVIGKLTIHAGPIGSAARLKLVINGIMGATLNVVAEGVSFGLSAGLDREVLFDALQQVAVISPHHKRKLKMAQDKSFPSQFPTRLMSKDMGLLMDAGRKAGAFMPAMAIADQALALSNRRHADEDYSALLGAMEHSVANTPHK
ncbi:NAD(P)-dependent oxidoreductase [Gluconobacter japonicus]|uniref:3-hydroxyisobutyrate dehydrogenase n=1 Tax=Gluconobacter japonicus TaxID=376620 RepID=A0A9Q2FLK7_GLUJA|nr:NAD(P)-dependent oxidoreductase [Gluconobacter japonicus]KXV27505.1 3-hydroxyisobutyrate dehydrogenase [Gluconobacter japonicus]KXV41271.1 3-hydroxyisobutyrate dehydrogenase [Gluconobacter japonicus]MBF0869638.1 NAD(P)-dependent oxidoreductase [Gluconobacter japonicus]MDI6651623.1 NAD(P)-dependent oxidoreductase [Gluconobacter japonicus]GBR18403.1 3-hydroxyisobutyrate dehydrogenase [Gluconobacter japonicus NBRC 3271]